MMYWFVLAVALASAVDLGILWWLRKRERRLDVDLFSVIVGIHPIVGVLVIAEVFVGVADPAVAIFTVHGVLSFAVLPLWVLFTLAYVDRNLLTKPVVGALTAVYLVGASLMVTNPLHGWLWPEVGYVAEPFPHVEAMHSLVGIVGTVEFILFLAAIGLLFFRCATATKASRTQLSLLLVGLALPVALIVGAYVGLFPATRAGYVSGAADGYYVVGSAATAGLVGWALFRHHVFDVTPMAREAIYEELSSPVLVLDASRRLLDYNRAAGERFPAVEENVRSPVEAVIPGVVAEGGEFADSLTAYVDDGPREFVVAVSRLERGGDVYGYGLVLRDVTELEEHVRDLEQKTAQLERFTSTLSHDLKNPLNVALLRAELAMEDGDVEHLEGTLSALRRIDQIVEDLRTLAREGRTIEEPERVSLGEVAESAWTTRGTGGADPTLENDADATIFADATRLRNVFENLFRNAVEHGGPHVRVRVGSLPDGFYVEDDGPGIPPEERERVFEYEYTTTESGTGLGLAIVEAISSAHGWSVHVEGGSDGGARFVFSGVDVVDPDGSPEEQVPAT